MAFVITDPYTVVAPTGMYSPAVVEQAGAFYAARIRQPPIGVAGTLECDSLGPYASAAEAQSHLAELPPAPEIPPTAMGAPE
jgi:hypothetical protein